VGLALNSAVGGARTVTLVEATGLVPPGPLQLIEKVVVPTVGSMLRAPLSASGPLQPPEAAHEVAWVELQLNVAAAPAATRVGAAASDAVGTAGGGVPPLSLELPPPQAVRISAVHASTAVDTHAGMRAWTMFLGVRTSESLEFNPNIDNIAYSALSD
jgi:hypothetical protein